MWRWGNRDTEEVPRELALPKVKSRRGVGAPLRGAWIVSEQLSRITIIGRGCQKGKCSKTEGEESEERVFHSAKGFMFVGVNISV